ncbi:5'-3'-deoxyribonucleotidase [Lacihabitans sp. LS3-19]|uniref:5' nucleotidase, NT5C type n=1 Tax=Lacihabitans sp. LS3-19 TaxID=2487335 RepID=UPI0020CE904D|nr:5'-3'-deoxyribonucleotidase [Lacihabitans sp. LS3-19]MCP9767698.1 5'-3'-deoxyribonucleotidase [Lacihabitans sp. LS3-19]
MKTIIIDMDDVMADASAGILDVFNELNGTDLKKDFFKDKNFYDFMNSGKYLTYRDRLFDQGFFINLEVMPDAQEVIKELSEKHKVYIVSAATEFPNSLREKYDWMQKYFPFISWRNFMLCGDKSIVKGDVMIDDHEKNLKTFSGETLLFDAMHNQQLEGYHRVYNWQEIHNYFFKN